LKKYHRELKATFVNQKQHGVPGSKAGRRREAAQQELQNLLDESPPDRSDVETYGEGDALLDDLMGNTLECQPTPYPIYYGHYHKKFYNKLHDIGPALATDEDISLVIRAYRDRHGTRRTAPVGLVAVLSHLLQDLHIPLSNLSEKSYTSLLTCCRTPAEGRRVLQLMKDQHRPISAYSYSILVDLYAKSGDWQGRLAVHHEMLADGLAPTLASYTSLLAGCARVCGDGRIAHPVRTAAAAAAWEHGWQEMFRAGIEPDVMAYGALLRLWAARGLGERALDTLEEMQRFGVKPTTLCYTFALRAIARSHATAIRYENGGTKRFGRRGEVTLHHGKLTRSVLIHAESAGVIQDDGFVAALTECAAIAGDVATAKAIYLASQLRREFGPQLRGIGPDEHLARLRGEPVDEYGTYDLVEGSSNGNSMSVTGGRDDNNNNNNRSLSVAALESSRNLQSYEAYTEREYGIDTRPLNAILYACSNALQNNLGTMWQGRENEGYLCINSLRLIAERRKPQYEDPSIPGAKITDNLTWDGLEHGEDRQPGVFRGVDVDENVAGDLDELDETYSKMLLNEDGELKEEFRKASPRDIWSLKYGPDREEPNADYAGGELLMQNASVAEIITRGNNDAPSKDSDQVAQPVSDIYFDSIAMCWKKREDKSPVATNMNVFEMDQLSDDSDDDADEESDEDEKAEIISDEDVTFLNAETAGNSVRTQLLLMA
jgi:pentatricopeptide repeat protein